MFPYRDDNPSSSFPLVTLAIIFANVLAFVYFGFRPDYQNIVGEYGFIPGASRPYTMFTSMFLHGDLFHLVFNMWYLWLFGDNLEDKFGKVAYLFFYLSGGVVAIVIHSLMVGGMMKEVPCIGASGAISAVMGGYVTLFPRARIRVAMVLFYYFSVIRISAVWFLGIWFVQQLLYGGAALSVAGSTGVAYWAHIGGFVYGLVFAWLMRMTVLAGKDFFVPQEDD